MGSQTGLCPLSHPEIVEAYFLEHRTKLLDIAAFLDRLDRAADGPGEDFRMHAFREALSALLHEPGSRTLAVQLRFSDPRLELREALDQKSADGAWAPGEDA